MGYIGLLLNAPYKIDSMVWMRIGIIFGCTCFSLFVFFDLANLTKTEYRKKRA
jgi:hypothetical protein